MEYTTIPAVQAVLGPSVPFTADAAAPLVVAAANDYVTRKRTANGYTDDDPLTPPGADVRHGAALYAVALWRERQSVESFSSFEDLGQGIEIGGSWPQIKRLLGIPRGHVDAPLSFADARARKREYLYPTSSP